MFEREQRLLHNLFQDFGDVFRRTGLPGVYSLPLPDIFHAEDIFPLCEPSMPSEQPDRLTPVFTSLSQGTSTQQATSYAASYTAAFSRYALKPLSFRLEEMFPQAEEEMTGYLREDYRQIWQGFLEEMQSLQRSKRGPAYVFTLYFLMKRYFSRVPSSGAHDISLFDAARIRAAIADCQDLYHTNKRGKQSSSNSHATLPLEKPDQEHEVLLIEGQVCGIRKFLQRLLSHKSEASRLANRIQGGAFYTQLLTETLAEYVLAQLDLTIVHQVWCTGGHFLLVAPNIPAITYHLKACFQEINHFVFSKFRGDLAVILENIPVSADTLHEDLGRVRLTLHTQCEREKTRLLAAILQEQPSWQFPAAEPEGHEQAFLERIAVEQERLGARLSRLNQGDGRLVKKTKTSDEAWKQLPLVEFPISSNMHIGWDINPSDYAQTDTIYLVNNPDEKFWGTSHFKYGFKLFAPHADTYSAAEAERANASQPAPVFRPPTTRVSPADMKLFPDMAKAGPGEYLGILRMDVDSLSAVFTAGFSPSLCSLSRLAALSTELEFFFSGYVHTLCRSEFCHNTSLLYAGGDDLCIGGAWDELMNLACRIYQDFQRFTCQTLTLSGALFLCKGTYPLHYATAQAQRLLMHLAKENTPGVPNLKGQATRRNAFAVFDHRLGWDDFFTLRHAGDALARAIATGDLTRRSVYRLLKLHQTWTYSRHLNTARLFYLAARAIQQRACRKLVLAQQQYLSHRSYLPMLIRYIALKTHNTVQGDIYAES